MITAGNKPTFKVVDNTLPALTPSIVGEFTDLRAAHDYARQMSEQHRGNVFGVQGRHLIVWESDNRVYHKCEDQYGSDSGSCPINTTHHTRKAIVDRLMNQLKCSTIEWRTVA